MTDIALNSSMGGAGVLTLPAAICLSASLYVLCSNLFRVSAVR